MRSLTAPLQINAEKKITTGRCQFNIDNGICIYSISNKHISATEAKQNHASVAFSFGTINHKNFFMKHFSTQTNPGQIEVNENKSNYLCLTTMRNIVASSLVSLMFVLVSKKNWVQTGSSG